MTGKQTIDIYTVGFATGTTANALLQKTATVGNGLFFTGTQAQDLTNALVGAISSIILKSQSFTAATVPATRTSLRRQVLQLPVRPRRTTDGYWEGYLQSWTITEAGEILDDSNGNCAFNGNPMPCLEGSFNPNAIPHWDAADEVPAPGRAATCTPRGSTRATPQKLAFTAANIDETHLGLTAGGRSRSTTTRRPRSTATSVGAARRHGRRERARL